MTWHVNAHSNEVFVDSSMKRYTEFFLLEYADECERVFVQDLALEVFECHCQHAGKCQFGDPHGIQIDCKCSEGYGGNRRKWPA